jgi:hypothetical protein
MIPKACLFQSIGLIAMACWRMTTSPSPGVGIGLSSTTKSAPAAGIRATRFGVWTDIVAFSAEFKKSMNCNRQDARDAGILVLNMKLRCLKGAEMIQLSSDHIRVRFNPLYPPRVKL